MGNINQMNIVLKNYFGEDSMDKSEGCVLTGIINGIMIELGFIAAIVLLIRLF